MSPKPRLWSLGHRPPPAPHPPPPKLLLQPRYWLLITIPISQITRYKKLELSLSPTLTFEEHIRRLIGMVSNKLNSLTYLQNRALKIIYMHQPNTDLQYLHTLARITSIEQRASRQLTCLMVLQPWTTYFNVAVPGAVRPRNMQSITLHSHLWLHKYYKTIIKNSVKL